jgi:hypothetical protein
MRTALAMLIALALQACASAPVATSDARPKALFVGRVESSELVVPLFEVMPDSSDGENDRIWHGEIYEVKLKVLDRLSGSPIGNTVTVKLIAHAQQFEGMTLAVLTSPDLAFYGVDIGTSWWENLSPEVPTLCVPDDLLDDVAFATYVARAKPVDDSHCMEIK